MLCCVVLLAIVGLVVRGRVADDPFPPTARWTPGADDGPARAVTTATVAGERPAPTHAKSRRGALRPETAAVLRWSAMGVLVYVAAITAMLAAGVAEATDDSALHWYARDLVFALMAALAVIAAARGRRTQRAVDSAVNQTAWALIGVGAAWAALGLVDMHLLWLFEVAHGQLLWDAVFHGAGFWAIAGGMFLLHQDQLHNRQEVSTV
jgi:hypothetical protein